MGDWSDNLPYEQREYAGHFYDTDEEEETEEEETDDLISRQAVMECFKKWHPYMATRLYEFEKELTAIPSVENRGTWRHYEGMLYCSECGAEFYDEIMEYTGDEVPKHCPDCGADMRGE